MRAVVVGAGAWGLPAALALARPRATVTCVDRDGPGNPWSSSSGPTRLWRVADPDPQPSVSAAARPRPSTGSRPASAVRSTPAPGCSGATRRSRSGRSGARARRGRRAHRRVPPPRSVSSSRTSTRRPRRPVVPRRGRDPGRRSHRRVRTALRRGRRDDRHRRRGGLRADTSDGATAVLGGGTRIEADAVVVCAGPGTAALLPGIGLEVPLRPFLEQVVHLGLTGRAARGRRGTLPVRRSRRPRRGHLHDADARASATRSASTTRCGSSSRRPRPQPRSRPHQGHRRTGRRRPARRRGARSSTSTSAAGPTPPTAGSWSIGSGRSWWHAVTRARASSTPPPSARSSRT